MATQTRVLGRSLVDAAGAEVPFWRATRVGSDTRIPAGGTWKDAFEFHPAGGGPVEVEVVHRGLPDAIAKELGVGEVEEHPMVATKVPFGPAQPGGGRAKLPKTITQKPPPPGGRPPRGPNRP